MKKKKVLFISSTGGHLNELLQLSELFEKYNYHMITEKDKTNENLKEKYIWIKKIGICYVKHSGILYLYHVKNEDIMITDRF